MPVANAPNFTDRLPPLPPVRITSSLLWTALLMMAAGALTAFLAGGYPEDGPLHHDIFSPVVALEVPHTAADLQIVLSPPLFLEGPPGELHNTSVSSKTIETARRQREDEVRTLFLWATWADFFFIASYVLFLWIAWKRISLQRPFFAIPLIVIAGVADCIENVGILRALGTPIDQLTDSFAVAIRLPSIVKWAALALVALSFAVALTRVELGPLRRPGTGLLAIVLFTASVFGATGLRPDIRILHLPWAAGWFSYRHLELFSPMFGLLPVTVVVIGFYERFRKRRSRAT